MKHIFTNLLSIILLGTNQACALKQEAYAIVSPDNTTLTFYYDNKKASRKGTAYEINAEDSIPKWVKCEKRAEFLYPENPNFTTVVFDESFKDARPVSCAYWFAGFSSLTNIEGINNLNTSNVTNMSNMFDGCTDLKSIDVSNFDTSNVTNMNDMFYGCYELTNLDVRNFNTSKVTDMSEMFEGCKSLKELDVRNFDTSEVTDMSNMFSFCTSLTKLDLSHFNTSNVTNMKEMFEGSENLKTIYVGNGWNTNKVEDSKEMFDKSTKLGGGKGTKFNSEITDITRAKIDGGKDNPGYFTAKK